MIKLIVADMDGTLLNEHSRLNEEFFEIFKSLKERNILFSAASGRQYYTLKDNFSEVKEDIIYIAENGSFVVRGGVELLSQTIDRETILELVRMGRKIKGFNTVLCGKKAAYIESKSLELYSEIKKYYSRHEIVENLEKVDDEFLKLAACSFNGQIEKINELVYPVWGNRLKVTISGKMWIDFNKRDINKGIGIRLLQDKYNIKPEETMAFGDYFNDIEMFDCSYYSYAMANAPEEVKSRARFLAKSNSENGVLEVIKEKVLNNICIS